MPKKDKKMDSMHYHFKCPQCGKRLFDALRLPREQVIVGFKCRNCNSSVVVEMSQKNLMDH